MNKKYYKKNKTINKVNKLFRFRWKKINKILNICKNI